MATWVERGSLRGPQGDEGPQGAQGEEGPEGPQGPPGSDANVEAHEAASDPHAQYLQQSEGDARYQPLDTDLTTFALLAPADNSVLQRKSGAWVGRTPTQVKTDLALTKADVGLSSADNTSDTNKPISTATQTALDAKADESHEHAAGDVSSGTLAIARIPTGTSGTDVALGNHSHSGYDAAGTASSAVSAHAAASDPHAGYLRESVLTAKGDIYAATGNAAPARLAVGTDGQVLTADSAQSTGVRWADATGSEESSPLFFATVVPSGNAIVDIEHDLNAPDVAVTVREVSSGSEKLVENEYIDANTIRLIFSEAPTLGQYRVFIDAGSTFAGGGSGGGPHTHTEADVFGLTLDLAEKADATHTHDAADFPEISEALDGKADLVHGHSQADITNLESDLAGKSDVGHVHAQADITGLSTSLTARVSKSTLTAKGDIYAASGNATPVRVGVGTDGQLLVADSVEAAGVKWADSPLIAHLADPDPHSQYMTQTEGDGRYLLSAELPAVYAAPRVLGTVNTNQNVDGTVPGDAQYVMTGNVQFTPTGTPNGRMLVVEGQASGATRTMSAPSSVKLPVSGGPESLSLSVPNGSTGMLFFRYSAGVGAWILTAAEVVT